MNKGEKREGEESHSRTVVVWGEENRNLLETHEVRQDG